jgi:hypothetical protein
MGRLKVRKFLVAGTIVAALSGTGTAVASDPLALPGGEEGCVSNSGDTCTYAPTRTGGYVADGSGWTLTVSIPANGDPRDTNLDGKLRYVFTTANAPKQGCGFFGAGSTVTTDAGASARLAAGNPFPAPADAVTGSANDCATGIVAASNPNYTPAD